MKITFKTGFRERPREHCPGFFELPEQLNPFWLIISRSVNRILSPPGFITPSLKFDAPGLSGHCSEKHVKEQYVIQNKTIVICNSHAYYPEQIGEIYTVFNMEETIFSEIKNNRINYDKNKNTGRP